MFRRFFTFLLTAALFTGSVYAAAVVDVDFEGTNPFTGVYKVDGTATTDGFGVQTEGTNHFLRLTKNGTGNTQSYAYTSTKNSATGTITGSYALRFTGGSSPADGASFMLDSGTPAYVGESGGKTGAFGIGYYVYSGNRPNQVVIRWNGTEYAAMQTYTDDTTVSPIKTKLVSGEWFTTDFSIKYLPGGTAGALVDVALKNNSGQTFNSTTVYIPSLNSSFSSAILLSARTGGATVSSDFDNIKVTYTDAATTTPNTWKANTSGSLIDAANWSNGTVPASGETASIANGTQTISNFNVPDGVTLTLDGGTTTTADGTTEFSKRPTVGSGSVLMINSGATLNMHATTRVGATDGSTHTGLGLLLVNGGTLNLGGFTIAAGYNVNGSIGITSGTISTTGQFILSDQPNYTGAFSQSGGTVTVGAALIGRSGSATMTQTGGTFTATDGTTLGSGSNTATLTTTGGQFRTTGLTIRKGSTATFNAMTVIDSAPSAGGDASYVMIGATTDSASNAVTIDSGATFSTNKAIMLGNAANSSGTMTVNGKISSQNAWVIGNAGTGTVTIASQSDLKTNGITLGNKTGGKGTLTLYISSSHIENRKSIKMTDFRFSGTFRGFLSAKRHKTPLPPATSWQVTMNESGVQRR